MNKHIIKDYLSIKIPILLFLFLSSCANLKIVEKSAKQKPLWVNGLEQNYLTGEGIGSDYNEAKTLALQMIKEKIVSAVAQNISFEQNTHINESRYKNAYKFLEEYTSKTTSKSGNVSYLQGVSLSKASDYYWEKHRENHVEKVIYYIKYPFTESDLEKLILEWETQEQQLTQRLDTLKFNGTNHTTVESIIEEIEELQYLSSFFIDQRKAVADISIKSLESKLRSIQIIPFIDTLGFYSYQLKIGDEPITTIQKPVIKSNCAQISKVVANNSVGTILYDFNQCNIEDDNILQINYNFEEWNLNHKVHFDVSSKKIAIENPNDIAIITLKKGLFSSKHLIKCHFTIYSKSPVPFKITRIELTPMLCKYDCSEKSDFKTYPTVVLENVNKKLEGIGNHSFEAIVEVPKKHTKRWASRNGISALLSGKIYYSSANTNENKICTFNDVAYTTNW